MRPPRSFITELRRYWYCTLPLLCRPTPLAQEKKTRWLGWLPKTCPTQTTLGFTLAEVLISLLILAEIATFTIPKVITGQQNSHYQAVAKEDIAMVSAAYSQLQAVAGVSAATSMNALTPYMNYIATSTSLNLDSSQGSANFPCTATKPCLILHNGSTLHHGGTESFGGTSTTNAFWFQIDPNSSYSGTTNGPDKSVELLFYYTGRVTDRGNSLPGTTSSANPYPANPAGVPPWFSW